VTIPDASFCRLSRRWPVPWAVQVRQPYSAGLRVRGALQRMGLPTYATSAPATARVYGHSSQDRRVKRTGPVASSLELPELAKVLPSGTLARLRLKNGVVVDKLSNRELLRPDQERAEATVRKRICRQYQPFLISLRVFERSSSLQIG
jgi:hypothetical protein